jgi:hypothetical protein
MMEDERRAVFLRFSHSPPFAAALGCLVLGLGPQFAHDQGSNASLVSLTRAPRTMS